MTHRIKTIGTLDKFVVLAIFQDGTEKRYDVSRLFDQYPQFRAFEQEDGLFEKAVVDTGGYGISWNDKLDISSEEIWENGDCAGIVHLVDIFLNLGVELMKARECVGITQKELAEKVQIYQGDISKIERGQANPSLRTLQRLADGMGMRVSIKFVKK